MAEKEVVYIAPPNNLRQKQKLAGVSLSWSQEIGQGVKVYSLG